MRKFYVILTLLGTLGILGLTTYIPFPGIYAFVLDQTHYRLSLWNLSLRISPDLFRLKITLAVIIVIGAMILIQFLLRKASKILELQILCQLLTWGIYYTGVVTALMLVGMWLDFQPCVVVPDKYYVFSRVGFIFYYSSPYGMM
ncbi:hypothetical protein JXM67_15135 [candidate division WOR-3 bacterium]|nr:hypothetical protein [candidate division WOR-3 bacterium]